MSLKIKLPNLQTTEELAKFISSIVSKGNVVLLKGQLGSGKTTFAKYFIDDSNVSSPTFGLVNVYEGKECDIWHYDLYRVNHMEEIYELGLDEALKNGITLIEWPDIIEDTISNDGVIIKLNRVRNSDVREAEIFCLGEFDRNKKVIEKFIKVSE